MSTAAAGPVRSLALLGTTAGLFALGLILEIWGGANFPENAPVEQFYCALVVLDIAAGFVAATTGALIASRDRHPQKRSTVVTIVGLILVVIALGGWIWLSGVGIVLRIPTGARGRYMYDVAGAVAFGIPWIVGTMLCAYGYRRGGSRANAIRGLLGTVVGLALLGATVASAVLYGLGLTD
ncbi:MAG TPA: hypothetical protein VGM38_01185 [Pseudolysinimonas sp.]